MGNPTWVYHPKQEAKIVDSDEAATLYKQGWADSPAKTVPVIPATENIKKDKKDG